MGGGALWCQSLFVLAVQRHRWHQDNQESRPELKALTDMIKNYSRQRQRDRKVPDQQSH